MKKIFLCFSLLVTHLIFAQNCPIYNINGGFESFIGPGPVCNNVANLNEYSVTLATGWMGVNSPDVFNSSFTNGPCISSASVYLGQYSAGFHTKSYLKEYIYQSCGTLIYNAKYTVTAYFKSSTGGLGANSNVGIWMIPNYVSNPLPYSQLLNPKWTSVGSGWYKYEATFIANSTNIYWLWIGSVSIYNNYICVDEIKLELSKPDLTITNDGPKCYPNCVNINAVVNNGSSPYTYSWSNGFTTQGQTLCTPQYQTYTLTVSDAAGCSKTATTNVAVYAKPTANAGVDQIICGTPNPTTNYVTIGQNPALCGQGNPKSYSWVPTAGLQNSTGCYTNAYPSATTNYTVYVTDLTTGCSSYDVVKVTVKSPPCSDAKTIENTQLIDVELFPNPNNGVFTFKYQIPTDAKGKLEIYDLSGKLISSFYINSNEESIDVNLMEIPNGIYLYKFYVNNELMLTEKLIINK